MCVSDGGGILIKDTFSTVWGGIVFACNDCCGGGARNTLTIPPLSPQMLITLKAPLTALMASCCLLTPLLVPTLVCETEGWKTVPANHALNVTKVIRWYGGGVRYSLYKLLGFFFVELCTLDTRHVIFVAPKP